MPGGGGGHSLIWRILGRAAGQGMVFWPLSPEQGLLLTGRRYGDRRFIKWARFCRDSQLA